MKTIELNGTSRATGKVTNKSLRNTGNVPCVLYGNGDPIHFSAPVNTMKKVLYSPEVYIVELDVDGNKETAIVREAQFHPVTEQILHVDFLRVNESTSVAMELPVRLTGTAPGILQGGKLVQKMRKMGVRGIPVQLPDALEVDISGLTLGNTIKVRDLSYPGIDIIATPAQAVVSVEISRAAKLSEGEEALEGEEGEEGEEGAEGGDGGGEGGGE